MSDYFVKTPFRDKDTNDLFGIGDKYYTEDQKRAKYLQEWGYLGEKVENDSENDLVDDISALTVDDLPNKSGWYELPNGEKVQGKENAEEALKELQGSDE